MNSPADPPLVLQALNALKALDRRKAASLLRQDLASAPAGGQRWLSVARLAQTMGERGLELEAMQRFSQSQPQTLDHILAYGQALSRMGRSLEAQALIDSLPAKAQSHPAVLHFRGMVASETGDFETAQSCFWQAVTVLPKLARSWYGLAVIKTFAPDDPDLTTMEALRPTFSNEPPEVRAAFLFALGKAWHDAGDTAKAAQIYNEGAALMRRVETYDGLSWQSRCGQIVRDFTPLNIAGLLPSRFASERVTFVTGLPRSGTTLVEQILTSHSTVAGGGELNLVNSALLPAGDASMAAAMVYQKRNTAVDPWGELAADYLAMVSERFGADGRVVDKTLSQSSVMGLLLHMLPKARVVWLRRNPEDCALSIFRTLFLPGAVPWSWSLADIASHMRGEDALHRHWTTLFRDRILTVPYEDLVREPEAWTRRILAHTGLSEEPQVFEAHTHKRSVMTASVAQVRAPITASRVGAADAYGPFMDEFRRAYLA